MYDETYAYYMIKFSKSTLVNPSQAITIARAKFRNDEKEAVGDISFLSI